MNFSKKLVSLIFLFSLFYSCKKKETVTAYVPIESSNFAFVKGADISWLTEMEASGKKFYNKAGQEQDLLLILKNLGINTIRLRVWVNPNNGWNNKNDLVAKAVRAKNYGMRILIDFHYSDTWADPANQSKPAAWASQNFIGLKDSINAYTTHVLLVLQSVGVSPEWVQLGNETNDGMLWPDGRVSLHATNFSQLISAGYDAVKSVFPNCKVIVHVSNGWDINLFRWLFDGLKANGCKWDVIGMSLYPNNSNWSTLDSQCLVTMNDMVTRYGKEVLLVEVGMSWDQSAAAYSFLSDIQNKTKSLANHKGLGVMYWEPEAYNNWQGYTLGAFDNSGKPTSALDAFN